LGGTYDGIGITNNAFHPSIAGPGLHKIKYTYTNIHACTNADSINITVYPLPIVAITGLSNSYCVNNSAIYLSGAPIGGTFSGNGVSSGFFDPAIAGPGDHNINYTYTDNHGCTNSSNQIVHVFPLPIVNINGLPSNICENSQPIGLTGLPFGGVFNGNGINGNSFIPSLAGNGSHNISYIYADTNGCVNQKVLTIVVNPKPIVSFSGLDSSYCFNDTIVALTGSPLGGTFSGNGVLNNSFNPNKAFPGFQTINYSYTDSNSCNNFISKTIEIYQLPAVNLINLNSSCCLNGSIINLNGNPIGGTYTGNGVYSDNFVPQVAGLGLHSLFYSFTDSLKCTNTDTAYILVNPFPASNAGPDTSMICSSSGLFIGGPATQGLTYQWYPTNGLSDSTISNPFASPAIPTIYTITTTDTLTNCSSTDDISVLLLNVPDIDLGKDTTICDGDSIELSSLNPAITYQWNTGATSQTIIVSPKINSSYTLTISDGVCANADTIEIRINSPYVSLGSDTIICTIDSLIIDAGIKYDSYLWNTGQISPSIMVSSNGLSQTKTYSVTITEEYCWASDSINIEFTKPIIGLGPDIVLYADGSASLDARFGYSSYLWSDNSTNQTLFVDSSGIGIGSKVFTVLVTDSSGCPNSDSIKVTFIDYPSADIPSTATITIFPNPSDGQIIIQIVGKHEELNFDVFNYLGQVISTGSINSNEEYQQETLIDLSYLAQGVYSICLKNENINEVIRIVIK